MSIGEVCVRQVVCTHRRATAAEAAQLMRTFHVGTLVVAEEADGDVVPLGVITDRDLVVGVIAAGLDPNAVVVTDIMGPTLVTARQNDDLYDTIRVMSDQGIRRLPVVDDNGKLVGIVSQDDVYTYLSRKMAALATVSWRQRVNESTLRE